MNPKAVTIDATTVLLRNLGPEMIHAFAIDVLNRIRHEPLRTQLDLALLERLPAAAEEPA